MPRRHDCQCSDCQPRPAPVSHQHERPVHRLAEHLKPHGSLQPQVPVGPLPKFHPLPTRPVFEPNYFDTVIGPAESLPAFGTGVAPSAGAMPGPLLESP